MLLRVVAGLVLAGLLAPGVGRAAPRAVEARAFAREQKGTARAQKSPARAQSEVREVQARLELDGEGRAQVELELGLLVRRGRLVRLELPGMASDALLAGATPVITRGGAPLLSAGLSREDGALILQLADPDALARGLHRLQLAYAGALSAARPAEPVGRRGLSWSLPRFPGARVEQVLVSGPPALRALGSPAPGVEVSSWLEGGRQVLRFRRTQPAASALQIALELPRAAAAGARAAPQRVLGGRWQTGLTLGAWIGLLCLWGRQRARSQLAALGRDGRGLLVRAGVPGWALLALALLSGAGWTLSPWLALCGWLASCVLALELAAPASAALALGRFEPLHAQALRALARARLAERSGLAWPDPASWLGAGLLLGSPLALAVCSGSCLAPSDPWGLGVLCALLARSLSSRLWLPRSLPEQVEVLTRAAGRMGGVDCALGLLWYAAGGRRSQPRLRILPPARYAGLLRLELLVDSRRTAQPQVLSVLVEAGSAAERWTRARWPAVAPERSQGSARLCFLRPVQDVTAALDDLLSHFTRESQRALAERRAHEHAA